MEMHGEHRPGFRIGHQRNASIPVCVIYMVVESPNGHFSSESQDQRCGSQRARRSSRSCRLR
jgi:hypothetical protein